MGSRDPISDSLHDGYNPNNFQIDLPDDSIHGDSSNSTGPIYENEYYQHENRNDVTLDVHDNFQESHRGAVGDSIPISAADNSHMNYLESPDSSKRHLDGTTDRRGPSRVHRPYLDRFFTNETLAYHIITDDGEIQRETGTLTTIRHVIASSTKDGKSDLKKFQRSDLKLVQPVLDLIHPVFSVHTGHYLIIIEKIRLVVLRDKILVFDPDENQTRSFVYYMYQNIQEWKKRDESGETDMNEKEPFEFMALEGLLWYLQNNFGSDLSNIQRHVPNHVNELSYDLNTKSLQDLRYIRIGLANLQARAEDVKDVLSDLKEDDKVWKMYLTYPKKSEQVDKTKENHDSCDEMKDLLNTYIEEIEDVEKRAKLLQEKVEDTEKLVNVHLDTLRNQLLSMELRLSIFSLTCGLGGVIAGVFGMNLPMPLFDEKIGPNAFYITIAIILVVVFGMTVLCWVLLSRRGLYNLY